MASFQDILSKPSSEIKPPSPIPVGTYLAIIDGQGEFAKLGKNQTDVYKVFYKLMQAGEDVDQAALQETLATMGKSLSEIRLSTNWFITEAAVYRLKNHLVDDLGIEEGSKSLSEMLPEMMGKQVYVTVAHRASEDGKSIFNDLKSFAKV